MQHSKAFDVEFYNKTLLIDEADERFSRQLVAARISRAEFFSQLAPIFMEGAHAGHFSACLIHRHYLLESGERMVTKGDSTRPSVEVSPNVIPDRWLASGEVFEHRYADDPASLPPAPSPQFFDKVRSVMNAHRIDTIGICYTPPIEELSPGFLFLEVAGSLDREQVTKVVPKTTSKAAVYQAIWTPSVDSRGQFEMVYNCGCNHGCCNICGKPDSKCGCTKHSA